jgi:hypothetical protein
MTQKRWRLLAALLSWALLGPAGRAVANGDAKDAECGKCGKPPDAKDAECGKCSKPPDEDSLVEAAYPIADLLHACGNCPKCPGFLVQIIPQIVAPESWCDQGGQGSIAYCEPCRELVIYQSPAVQKQVADLLKTVEKLAAACSTAMSGSPACGPARSTGTGSCCKGSCTAGSCHGATGSSCKASGGAGCSGSCTCACCKAAGCACSGSCCCADKSPAARQHFRLIVDGFQYKDADSNGMTIRHLEIEFAGSGADAASAASKSEEKANADKGDDNNSLEKVWNVLNGCCHIQVKIIGDSADEQSKKSD